MTKIDIYLGSKLIESFMGDFVPSIGDTIWIDDGHDNTVNYKVLSKVINFHTKKRIFIVQLIVE